MIDQYQLVQSTPPTAEVVTAEAMVEYAGQVANSEPALLTEWAKAARQLAEDYTGRQFITATWVMYLDRFPAWEIQLQRPPWSASSITSIVYTATDGTSTTLSASDYRLDHIGGRLTPAYGEVWPTARDMTNAVAITYTSGYGTAATSVPAGIATAIKMTVVDWHVNRGGIYRLPAAAEILLREFWWGQM